MKFTFTSLFTFIISVSFVYFMPSIKIISPIFSISILIFSIFLAILIHEIGHTLIAKKDGWNFISLSVGPFKIIKEKKLKIVKVSNVNEFFGLTAIIPSQNMKYSLRNSLKRVAIAGPISSLLFFFLLFFSSHIVNLSFLKAILQITSLPNFLIGITTLMPFQFGSLQTDGKLFLLMRKESHLALSYLSLFKIKNVATSSLVPSKWNLELLRDLENYSKPIDNINISSFEFNLQLEMRLYLFYYYIDTKNYEKAEDLLTPVVKLMHSKTMRKNHLVQVLYNLYITFLAIYNKDSRKSRYLFNKLTKNLSLDGYGYRRAEIMILYAEQNFAQAKDLTQKIYYKLPFQNGMMNIEKEWYKAVLKEDECS